MKKNVNKLVILFLCILPIIDLITSIITRFNLFPITIGAIVKGLMMAILIIYVFFFSKSKYQKKSIFYFLLLIIFFAIYILTKKDIWHIQFLINEINYALKYMFLPVCFLGFLNLFEEFKITENDIKKILITNCSVYSFLMLVSYISGTGFNTYNYGSFQAGSNGWFFAANDVGSTMVLLLPSIYLFFSKSKNKYLVLLTLIPMFVISTIGTKVCLMGSIFIIVMISLFLLIKNFKKHIFIVLILLLVTAGLNFYSPSINYINKIYNDSQDAKFDEKDEEIEGDDNRIYLQDFLKNENVLKTVRLIFNNREVFFINNFNIYAKASSVDKIFGIGWNNRNVINDKKIAKIVEIDTFDIWLHYGIIGFIIYYAPFVFILCSCFVKLIKEKVKQLDILMCFFTSLLTFGISSIAGHVLGSPAVSIYMVYYLLIIYWFTFQNKNVILEETTQKKKITILNFHLNYGGIEKYISSICEMLGEDYDIELGITYRIVKKPSFYLPPNVKIHYLTSVTPNRDKFLDALRQKKIGSILIEGIKSIHILLLKRTKSIEYIRNIKSDYIITTNCFYNTLVGKYASKKIYKISTEHNYHNNDKKYISKFIKSNKKIDKVVLVSNDLYTFYNELIPNKCVYIPNTVDSKNSVLSNLSYNSIINIGRFSKEKGLFDLVDVVKIIKETIPNIKCYLIGDGYLNTKLRNYIEENKLSNNFIMPGFLNDKQKQKYFLKSSIYVMTSFSESFGLTLLEAMNYGLSCVAFDSANGAQQILKSTGYLISNRNKQDMASCIIDLLKNKKMIRENIPNNLTELEKYNSRTIKKKWIKLLNI